jgi:PhnB protein
MTPTTTINPYLQFNGDCEAAFNFYRAAFGGDFQSLSRYSDVPGDEMPVSESDKERIMHVSLPIGDNAVLMGSDTPAERGATFGSNVTVAINPKSEQEADRLFAALSAGGSVSMPMARTFWNAYFGMFTDKFGVYWMINYTLE